MGERCISLKSLGEVGLIERLRSRLRPGGPSLIVGPGDDCSAFRLSEKLLTLATCDIMIEGEHFLPHAISPYQLGRKSLALNVSDIAAMGGLPRFALISLALPAETPLGFVDELYRGLQEEGERWGVSLIGGNCSRSKLKLVDIFLLGEVEEEFLLLRSGARPGDNILVTGSLGDSRGGLELLRRSGLELAPELAQALLASHLTPPPRLPEARAIARSRKARAMMDISDGLASDLQRLCQESGVGAEVEAESLPVSAALRALASALDTEAHRLALEGGEDYELLLTAPAGAEEELKQAVREATGRKLSLVGRITEESSGIRFLMGGRELPLDVKGWDHFAGEGRGSERGPSLSS